MNNQSTSNKSVPSTSGSSNQQGKTQVFILSPDVLKKLGIANKIPNFPLVKTTGKASNSKSTAQVKKDDVNLGENMKNKLTSVLNKKINDPREPKNETKKCDKIVPGPKCDENSVKLKLLSMLTSKSEKEKVKNTSCSVQTIKETQTSNLENQIKPKEKITSNIKETKLLHNCNAEENSVTKIDKPEIDVKINEFSKHDNETEINLETITNRKINKPIKNINSNKNIQSNKKTNTKEISQTKHPEHATTILKSISSKESCNINFRSENENYFSDVKIDDINKTVVLNENKDNKTCGIDAAKHNIESTVKTNEQEKTTNIQSTEKTPRRGRKRKIIEESPHEESESVSSVRKSVRKRKLSTFLSDYVTELKLPDESSQKISNKSRKSTDSINIDNPNSITKDCNDSNKNDSIISEHTASKTENETEKLTKVPETISSAKISSANTIISKPVSISKNTAKEIDNKIPSLQLNAPSSSSICNKSEFTSKNILQSHLKNKISNVTNEEAQKTHSVADKVSNEIIPDMVKEKSNKISEQKEIYQEIKIKQNTPATSIENVKVISNKNESNNVGQKLITYLDVGTRKINMELPTQIIPNIPTTSKKQIIIHENILIKPSNENYLNNEAEQSENTAISTKKSLDKDVDSSLKSENIAVLTKEDTVNDDPINLKMKSPLKTYPGKVKKVLSTNAELCAEYTDTQSSSNSEPNQIEKLSSDKHIHSPLKTDNTKVLIKEDDVNDFSTDITFKVKTPLKTYPGKVKGRLSTDTKPLAKYIGEQNSVHTEIHTEPNQSKPKSVTCIPIENISSETIVTKISDSPIKIEVHKNIKEKQNTEICSLLNIKPNETKITCTPESNENISKEALARKINSSVKTDTSENIEEKQNTEICAPLNYKENELKPIACTPEPNKNISEETVAEKINLAVKSETSENIEETPNSEICSPLNYKVNELKVTTYIPETNKTISEEAVVDEINSLVKTKTSENIEEKPNSEICSPLNNKAIKLNILQYFNKSATDTVSSLPKETKNLPNTNISIGTRLSRPEKGDSVYINIGSQIENLQSSDNLSEEGLNLAVTAESKTNQSIQEVTTKQDLLTYSEITTGNKRSPKQIETIQEPEVDISEPEICNSPTATETKTSVNVYQKELTDSETPTLLNTPNRRQIKPPKQIRNVQESEVNKSEEIFDSPIATETKTSVNMNQKLLTDSETLTLLTTSVREQRKPSKPIENVQESEINIIEPETCDSSISKETKSSVNSNQEILTDSESPTFLTMIVPEHNKPPKQIQNVQESELNISEPEICDSLISTETKASVNSNQEILTDSESSPLLRMIVPEQNKHPKQIQNVQESELKISIPETCVSSISTETNTSVNMNQEILTDSESSTVLTMIVPEQSKLPKQIQNVQESELKISKPETCVSSISTETKTCVNMNQEILTDSESSTVLTMIVPEQSKPPKQIQNVQESELKISKPETCDSSVSTETKTSVNINHEILTDSESSTVLTMIVPEQKKPPKQIQNVQESELNISEPEICDSPISLEIKTNVNINQEILTDSESSTLLTMIVPEQNKPLKQLQNVQESELNISEPETCHSPISSDINTIVNINQEVLTDSETTMPLKTPNRRQRKPPKQIKNIQESEAETIDSSIATETKISVNVNKELLTDSETSTLLTTLVQRQRKPPQQIKNNQESEVDISEPETCNSPTATETKTSVNVKQEVITISEATSYLKVPPRRKGRPPKKKIEESASLSEPETCNSFITAETKPGVNANQELLTDSETSTLLTTPVRRQRKPPQQIRNIQESEVDVSEPETCNSPTATKTKTNVNVKQEEIKISEPTSYLKVPPRRRGRPPKIKIKESTNLSESETLDSSTVEEELEVTPVRHGRGRGKREVEENSTPGEIMYKKIPGRGRKRYFNEMENNDDPWKFKDGTCAVCNETVTSSDWPKHSMKHNFLCWRIGEAAIDLKDKRVVEYVLSKGLKENSKAFKHFICPQCDDKKKSVLGYIAHMEICQLTEEERMAIMYSCTICDKKVMPQSMKSHMRIHEYSSKNVEVVKKSFEINVNEDTPRTKRKAATKAVDLIQEVTNHENIVIKRDIGGRKYYKQVKNSMSVFVTFGVIKKIQSEFNKGSTKCKFENCNFETNVFDDYKTHLNACPALNADDYICRYCLFVDKDESIMKEHVKVKHIDKEKENFKVVVSGSESEDDDAVGDNEISSEEEIPNPNKPKKIYRPAMDYIKPAFRVGFLAKERRIVRNPVCSFLPALRWTREFIRENYSKHLYENIKCLASKWTSVSLSEEEKYMPRWKKSMSVKACSITYTFPKLQNKEHIWKEYELLETNLEDDTATIFCGGPIWGLAWVPTPINTIYDQYLAVSVQKDFEATYKISETSTGHELIQIWNFGPLDSKVTLKSTPTLEFSIAHNHGMVWCMEWCPSGFYDTTNPKDSTELRRLGLLALACSDGNIPIYAIGIPHKDKKKNHNIFNVQPAIKLVLQEEPMEQLLGQWKYQATKLSWSKSSGHNIIAGGYSNGVVCLWDLENTSPLLRSEEKGVTILKPYHSFQAHSTAISALVLYPLIDKGKRWLLTGSWDRTLKYWDVNNTTAPISTYGKRGMITDGVWITHWLCTYSSFDDVFSLGHTVTTVQNPRDFGFRQCSALASNSFVMALSANDWASAVAQGTLAGELTTTFPRAILISYDVDKHLKCKRMMLSYSEIIDKTKDVTERKDIMMTENKSNQSDNEKDEKLFSRYLNDNDKNEPYVEQPSTYEEAREKFGMLFCDFKLAKFNYIPEESLKMVKQSSRLREVPTEMYPFTSLNRVAWNPNRQAYLYVACGYQNGFVRLRCIRFMNTKISDS